MYSCSLEELKPCQKGNQHNESDRISEGAIKFRIMSSAEFLMLLQQFTPLQPVHLWTQNWNVQLGIGLCRYVLLQVYSSSEKKNHQDKSNPTSAHALSLLPLPRPSPRPSVFLNLQVVLLLAILPKSSTCDMHTSSPGEGMGMSVPLLSCSCREGPRPVFGYVYYIILSLIFGDWISKVNPASLNWLFCPGSLEMGSGNWNVISTVLLSSQLISFYLAPMHAGVSRAPWQLLELADLQGEALIIAVLRAPSVVQVLLLLLR